MNTSQSRFHRLRNLTINRQQAKQHAKLCARTFAPLALAMAASTAAHAQGSMDSQAQPA